MTDRPELAYGSWPTPISIEMAVASALSLREARLDGDDVYWTEGRPDEGGRQVIVRWNEAEGAVDLTPPPFNARTMAHEYGGGFYAVDRGSAYFVNLADGRIYIQAGGAAPEPVTEEGPYRHGDLVVDRRRNRLLCVREDMSALAGAGNGGHPADRSRASEPQDQLVAVDLTTGKVQVLATGYDFYSSPRPSPDGNSLAWLAWRHPNMPWDGTELWVAGVDDAGLLADPRLVAGGGDEAVVQPEWAPDGTLVFASDRTGWWNLYRLTDPMAVKADERKVIALAPMEAEFSGPLWVFGMRWFGIAPDGTIAATAQSEGRDHLWMIPASGLPERIEVPDEQIDSLVVGDRRVAYIGSSATEPRSIVLLDLALPERRVLRRAFDVSVDREYLSLPEQIAYPTTEGDTAYALYYPPANPAVTRPASERPPLVVMTHGGPTSRATSALDYGHQVFTSRGFAVVDVNYRGSSGHGREYMRRLDTQWGKFDVDDAVAAARYLVERGEVDPQQMCIRGGSAGGYTTLCALVFHDVFGAGASYYGVGDLEALARDTHKFESRYLDRLVAPYPAGVDVYRARSPVHFIDRITRPVIVFQGEDDMVVPIAQAEQLVASLRERRIPHAYLPFAGEGHGFRRAPNMRRAFEAELSFYAQVFGFDLADAIEPVRVEYL